MNDLQKYKKWLDKLMCIQPPDANPYENQIVDARPWAEYKTVSALVHNLLSEKYGDDMFYQDTKHDMDRFINEAVAMTLFYKEEPHDN